MLIDISGILLSDGESRYYDIELGPDDVGLEDGKQLLSGISISLHIYNEDGYLHVKGYTEVALTAPCDRCLTETKVTFPVNIDEEYEIRGNLITLDDDAAPYFTGESLDAEKLLHDSVLSSMPSKVLCKEDCKGLCPVCGQNLNERDCGCDRTVGDPRMEKFKELFEKFKEV